MLNKPQTTHKRMFCICEGWGLINISYTSVIAENMQDSQLGDTGESQEGLETTLKGLDLGLWDG